MDETYEPGELFVYINGDRWELGVVKRPGSGNGYFCWYSRGDTAAFTPARCMHKLANAGYTHIEQLLDTATVGAGTCHTVAMDCFGNSPYNQSGLNGNSPACGCSECGAPWSTTGLFRGNRLKHNFKACPICGARVVSE